MNPQQLTGSDVCCCLHTALRKCCDSNITSAAYNLIHLVVALEPPELNAWHVLGDLVAERMSQPPAGTQAKGSHALRWALDHLDERLTSNVEATRGRGERIPRHTWTVMWALLCTLRCFDGRDIEAMTSYLDD